MRKVKYWLVQLVMVAFVSLILGAPAFAKAPEQSKGNEMKNAHASGVAKSNAHSNAGFGDVADTEPVGEEGDAGGNTGDVDYEATCVELYGSFASFNSTSLMCTSLLTFESTQL